MGDCGDGCACDCSECPAACEPGCECGEACCACGDCCQGCYFCVFPVPGAVRERPEGGDEEAREGQRQRQCVGAFCLVTVLFLSVVTVIFVAVQLWRSTHTGLPHLENHEPRLLKTLGIGNGFLIYGEGMGCLRGLTHLGKSLSMCCRIILHCATQSKGAIIGGITSLLLVGTLIVGSQTAVASKQIVYPTKPTSTIGCSHLSDITTENVNHTIFQQETVPEAPFILFRISFMYFNPIGCLTVLTVGSIVSWFARTNTSNTETVNRDLLSPVIYRWLSNDNINKEIIVAEPLLTLK